MHLTVTPYRADIPFVTEREGWESADLDGKACRVVDEWLRTFDGEQFGRGPLTRYTREQWRAVFDEVGYFTAVINNLVGMDWRGRYTMLGARVTAVTGSPTPPLSDIPRLFRYGTAETNDRWSWSEDLYVVSEIADSFAGYSVWVCDDPRHVFGCIEMRTNGTKTFSEVLMIPGDVEPWQDIYQSSIED